MLSNPEQLRAFREDPEGLAPSMALEVGVGGAWCGWCRQ